jgi:UDP:flavonoid glycosyltransferase YjiC (YdhE family)
MTLEKQLLIPYDRTNIEGVVESEIDAFKNEGIDLIVSSFTPTCCISARVLKIPLVVLASGTASSLYYRSGYATFPENYENVFTKMLPTFFKKYITRWMLLNNKVLVKDFNKVAKKYNIRTFKTLNEIFESGHTLFCDDINFLGIKPTKEFPIENFIGPILPDYSFDKDGRTIDSETENHLKKNNQSILVTLGSSGTKQIFLEILNVLNKTNYNVIAVYADIVKSSEIPALNDNILLKKFVPSIKKVNEMVDLAIIHGGRGTIYTAAYSGKPIIGIPMHIEQQYNIDCLVRHGVGLMLSKRFFKPKNFLQAINEIFDNYDTFFKNAQELSAKLQKSPMEDKALQIIMRILDEKA